MDLFDASRELADVDLGDARLNRRAVQVVRALQQRPSVGFPMAFNGDAELEGFYRLVNNKAVEPDTLLAPHAAESWRRAQSSSDATLVLHDTTEFTFQGEAPRVGLAQKQTSQGFHGHFALAVAEGEAPAVHGVVGHRSYVVEDGTWLQAVEGQQLEELLVGSERWSDLVRDVASTVPDGVEVVHVMDREADDYAVWTRILEQGDDFVIRARHDRRLANGAEKLFNTLANEPFVVSREVVLSRRGHRRLPGTKRTHPARDRRSARLSIRAGVIEIQRPVGVAPVGEATMKLSFVEVVEIDPPDDTTPIHWLLLSTLPVDTPSSICRIVDIYRKRWLIEEFFKSLKTGCAAEKRQGRLLWSLLNTIALLVPVAWRLLLIRATARQEPAAPASRIIDAIELQALRHLAPKAKLGSEPTCRQILLAVAKVGGHLISNGEPGWLVLGRGLERLLEFSAGWRAALEGMSARGDLEM